MIIRFAIIAIFVTSCLPRTDTFNSEMLSSSKGEKIYINSLNWGVTNDHQMSVITKTPKRLKERSDTINVAYGLDPFIYRFENDTLKLFFEDSITCSVKEKFKTIIIESLVMDSKGFDKIRMKAYSNDGYYSVPKTVQPNYPSDMPKPPSE